MGAVQKLSIALTEELARDIAAAVASGDYSTASEVVRDAMRLWKQQRAEREAKLQHLRNLWNEGIASGRPRPVPDDWAEQVIAEGGKRLASERNRGDAA